MCARRGQSVLLLGLAFLVINVHAEHNLPKEISEALYCTGCKATITEIDRIIQAQPKKNLDGRVDKALKTVCKADRFKEYEFIPPKMLRACKYIMENYEDMLKDVLRRHYSPDHDKPQPLKFLEKNFCRIITKACLYIEDNEATEQKKKKYEKLEQDEMELDGQITKIPKNAKVATPVRHDTPLEEEPVVLLEDEDVFPEESINAPLHENDRIRHTEL